MRLFCFLGKFFLLVRSKSITKNKIRTITGKKNSADGLFLKSTNGWSLSITTGGSPSAWRFRVLFSIKDIVLKQTVAYENVKMSNL